jgi:hypothetical protein
MPESIEQNIPLKLFNEQGIGYISNLKPALTADHLYRAAASGSFATSKIPTPKDRLDQG